MNEKYFEGAVMAYRDCADLVKQMQQNLPDELKMFAPAFDGLFNSILEKSNTVLFMVQEAKEAAK